MTKGIHLRQLIMLALVVCVPLSACSSGSVPTQGAKVAVQPTPTSTPAGVAVPQSLRITKTIEPSQLLPGQMATVTVTLQGVDSDKCLGAPGAPLDVIFIVDNSVSARVSGRLDRAKAKAQSYIDQLGSPVYLGPDQPPLHSRVGIITSNYTEKGPQTMPVKLDGDFTDARAKLGSMVADADTALESGIRTAGEELLKNHQPEARRMVLLVVHDNVPFTPEAIKEAQNLLNKGIAIYVIGVGREGDLNPDEVTKLTGSVDHYFFEPSPETLYSLFVRASGGRDDLAAKGMRITEEFTTPNLLTLVPGSVRGEGAELRTEEKDGHPVWRVPYLEKGQIVTLSYRVQASSASAVGQVVLQSSAVWLDCNGQLGTQGLRPSVVGNLDVVLPTNIPTPARTTELPSTALRTPTPTHIPLVVGIPLPTMEIPIVSPLGRALLPLLPSPWREILIILLIPLFIWLLWQLLKLLRRATPPRNPPPPVVYVEPPRRPVAPPPQRLREPVAEPRPVGAATPGTEGDDEALLRELLSVRSWRGYIATTELGLKEPWPTQIRTLFNEADVAALGLGNKGIAFYWRKEDGTGVEIPISALEKVLAQVVGPRQPVVVVSHIQPTDNLLTIVDVVPNEAKRQMEVAVRAVYREPEQGQKDQPLKYFLNIRTVEQPIGLIVTAPILEQNL